MVPSQNPSDRTQECAVEDRIERLAQTWQDLRDKGDASSFEDVCAQEPELIPAVKEWLAKVDQMEAKLATESVGSTVTGALNSEFALSPPQGPDELGRLGKYRILRLVGQGGMGRVYLAEDVKLNRRVAVKVLIRGGDQRFQREAKTLALIDHDHIVSVYDLDEERGTQYLAMPYLQGETLDSRLRSKTKLPLLDCLRIAKQIALGLSAAHRHGIVHRDIKPSNVWLEKGSDRVKILDFGLARQEGMENLLSNENTVVGTPGYMSPEQVQGENADARSDLFSLGCILYQMISGVSPFSRKDILSTLRALELDTPEAPAMCAPGTPESLSSLTMQLLAKKPSDRPASAHEVAAVLEAIEKDVTPSDVWPALLLPARRSPLPWIGASAVIAGVAIGFALWSMRRSDEATPVDVGPKEPPPIVKANDVEPPPVEPPIKQPSAKQPLVKAAPISVMGKREFDVKFAVPGAKENAKGVLNIPANKPFEIAIDVDRTAYVGVWLRTGDGSVTQLFPNEHDPDNRVVMGTKRIIPGNKSYVLKAPSTGDDEERSDLLLAVATTNPWKWEPGKLHGGFRTFGDTDEILEYFAKVVLKPNGPTPPMTTIMPMNVRFTTTDVRFAP